MHARLARFFFALALCLQFFCFTLALFSDARLPCFFSIIQSLQARLVRSLRCLLLCSTGCSFALLLLLQAGGTRCGFRAREYHWNCPGCTGWDTYPPRRIEELDVA